MIILYVHVLLSPPLPPPKNLRNTIQQEHYCKPYFYLFIYLFIYYFIILFIYLFIYYFIAVIKFHSLNAELAINFGKGEVSQLLTNDYIINDDETDSSLIIVSDSQIDRLVHS